MKTKLLLMICILISSVCNAQLFQKNYEGPQKHFKNANLANINDGSDDLIIASNLFDSSTNDFEVALQRVDENGDVIWSKTYENTSLQGARVFDIENYFDWVLMTGAVNVAGINQVFIAKIEAFTGNVLDVKYYEIVNSNFHSTGLKIKETNSDADGNGSPDPGFVVVGFFGDCPDPDASCSDNLGFVLRTDTNLNNLWAIELDSFIPGSALDYDFINGIVETNDGFILTGSVSAENANGITQQGVLAHKIDFEGNFEWDSSYIRGNSNDLSVDGIYDPNTDEVFLLCNYSFFHHFGLTSIDNSNGNINTASSWIYNEIDFELDHYGFSLLRSITNANNLVVQGYRREYFDPNTNTINDTNVILFEFDKTTGNQVGDAYQYLIDFNEIPGDVYNFWNGQMPLAYYPDMSILSATSNGDFYHSIGYREGSASSGSLANIELIKLDNQFENSCDNLSTDFTTNALGNITSVTSVSSGNVPVTSVSSSLVDTVFSIDEDTCNPTASTEEFEVQQIKVYPNPSQGQIFIESEPIANIKIHSISGKLMKEFNSYNHSSGISIDDLPTGIYFMSLQTNGNRVYSIKIIKK